MVRALKESDTRAALELLRARPLANVFLEHVLRSGVLGRVPGIFGWEEGESLRAILMIGPQGGTALEVAHPAAFAPLAECAARQFPPPRHIIGNEQVTLPFWGAFESEAQRLVWTRREPVYEIDRDALEQRLAGRAPARIEPAREQDLDELVINSALQHREDLGEDRFHADPEGFRRRHLDDIRSRRWWVLRERRRISFQVHVGPENAETVQIGGVLTPPDLRERGIATRGVESISALLLGRRPSVSLFCSEDNAPARRVYERVGFGVRLHNRSYLLEESDSLPAEYA